MLCRGVTSEYQAEELEYEGQREKAALDCKWGVRDIKIGSK